jgi:hypothetical protein
VANGSCIKLVNLIIVRHRDLALCEEERPQRSCQHGERDACRPNCRPADAPLPYPPSWLDQVTAWVRQLPVPGWLFYLTLWLLLFCIETLVKWRDSTYAVGTLYPFHLVFTATAFSVLSTKQYLEEISTSALHALRPVLNMTAGEYNELHYRLTTFPARPILLVSCIGIGIGLLFIPLYMLRVPSVKFGTSALAFGLDAVIIVWTWANLACAVYATIHFVRLVDSIYTTYTQIDLFELDSLYAPTRPLAFLTLSLLFWSYAWLVTTPGMLTHPVGLGVFPDCCRNVRLAASRRSSVAGRTKVQGTA